MAAVVAPSAPAHAGVHNVVCMPGMTKLHGQEQYVVQGATAKQGKGALLAALIIAAALAVTGAVYGGVLLFPGRKAGVYRLNSYGRGGRQGRQLAATLCLTFASLLALGVGVPLGVAYNAGAHGATIKEFITCAKGVAPP